MINISYNGKEYMYIYISYHIIYILLWYFMKMIIEIIDKILFC